MAEDDAAVAELHELAKTPGALKIITNQVNPEAGENPDPYKIASFIWHDVVQVVGPDDKGRCTAFSAEGDWTAGYPSALLARLQQWQGD